MMRRYENIIQSRMVTAEKDYKNDPEHKRSFAINVVLRLWEAYHQDKQIDESQFDKLIGILASFSSGEYSDFINEQVKLCKAGNPPSIVGY